MAYNPVNLFNNITRREHERVNTPVSYSNEYLFKPKVNNSYVLRLLWLPPGNGCNREYPLINQYIHKIWDENAQTGNKEKKVICPTSQYLMGECRAAFNHCPICQKTSEFYSDKSQTSQELYNKFRRTCMGYVPVYIVSGPEEDVGQVKILQYGKQMYDFFNMKLFGLQPKSKAGAPPPPPIDPSDIIGVNGFMYYDENKGEIVTAGYNLTISVGIKRMTINGNIVDMPSYSMDFKRNMTNITMLGDIDLTTESGIEYFLHLNDDVLHYDKDFYLVSSDEELQQFKLTYLTPLGVDSPAVEEKPAIAIPKRPPVETSVVDDPAPKKSPMPKSAGKYESQPPKQEIMIEPDNDGEVDIDDLIDGLID